MNNKIIPIFSLICAVFLCGSCGQAKYSMEQAAKSEAYYGNYDVERNARTDGFVAAESPAEAGDNQGIPVLVAQGRKLVKSAEIHIRVEDPAKTEQPLGALMEKYGAWPASTGVYENSRSYTIRVPSAEYDSMLADLAGLGKMLRRAENAEDVTLRYYDIEGRLVTRQELLKTYQEYLGKAKNIEEIMTVESKIADLQYEIDSNGTQLRNLANLVDYSTINLEISGPVNAVLYSRPGLEDKLKTFFGSFGDMAGSALVALIGIIVWGVPAVLVFILLFYLLFGRIGLLKRLWRLALGKKTGGK